MSVIIRGCNEIEFFNSPFSYGSFFNVKEDIFHIIILEDILFFSFFERTKTSLSFLFLLN